MKRDVVAHTTTEVKAPETPRSEERVMADVIQRMIAQMGQRWRNQVLRELSATDINKFADANYGRTLLSLAGRVKRKLLKQFTNSRIEKLAKTLTSKVNLRNKKEFYARLEGVVGITRAELEATEGLTSTINALQLETAQWIKKMRDDTLEQWTAETLRQMTEGQGIDQIMAQFDNMVETRKNHAKMVARTQIASFNSLTTKARAQKLGIQKAIWVTSKDERVRSAHSARDGKEFDLAKGLYSSTDGKTLYPGTDYQCRCDYRLVIPGLTQEDLE
jgi:SPP1 gp7 family putative phage head morphogenesis protein